MIVAQKPTKAEIDLAWEELCRKGVGGAVPVPFIPDARRTCPEFIYRLLQTFPCVWKPEFFGYSAIFDEVTEKYQLFLEVQILETGLVTYPLGEVKVSDASLF